MMNLRNTPLARSSTVRILVLAFAWTTTACSDRAQRPASEPERLLQVYVPGAHVDMSAKEVRRDVPDAWFAPYLGYALRLQRPIDGLNVVEFAFPGGVDDFKPPGTFSRVYQIQLSAAGTTAGSAALIRARRILGPPTLQGCSTLGFVARANTYVWLEDRNEVVLEVTAVHAREASGSTELYFLHARGDWKRVAPSFVARPCTTDPIETA